MDDDFDILEGIPPVPMAEDKESFNLVDLADYVILHNKSAIDELIKSNPRILTDDDDCEDVEFRTLECEVLYLSKFIVEANYPKVFLSPIFKSFLTQKSSIHTISKNINSFPAFVNMLEHEVNTFINEGMSKLQEKYRSFLLLLLSASYLEYYLQINYTGPLPEEDEIQKYTNIKYFEEYKKNDKEKEEIVKDDDNCLEMRISLLLSIDSLKAYPLIKYSEYLIMSHSIIVCLLKQQQQQQTEESLRIPSLELWCTRAGYRHLETMQSTSDFPDYLIKELNNNYSYLLSNLPEKNPIKIRLFIEYGIYKNKIGEINKSLEYFKKAKESSGLILEESGALSKSTKYQTIEFSKLVIKAKSSEKDTETDKIEALPRNYTYEESESDTILLEKIKYNTEDEDILHPTSLKTIDQIIILCYCLNIKNSNAKQGLVNEQMKPYIERTLIHPTNWMVYSLGLYLRSLVEFENNSMKERSLLQLQVLIDQHTNNLTLTQSNKKTIEESEKADRRLLFIHETPFPPRWLLLESLAKRYLACGISESAFEIYKQLKVYNKMIVCKMISGQNSQAKEIIMERLKHERDPELYCLLGDIENNPKYFEESWELSKHKYSRAQRLLGQYYYNKEDFKEATEHFKLATSINSLNEETQFLLGICAMRIDDYNLALKAFTRVVVIDPNNGEAWANISGILLQLKKPLYAYKPQMIACKLLYDNWRCWENMEVISLASHQYGQCIVSINRLIDLKKKKNDASVGYEVNDKILYDLINGILNYKNDKTDEDDDDEDDNKNKNDDDDEIILNMNELKPILEELEDNDRSIQQQEQQEQSQQANDNNENTSTTTTIEEEESITKVFLINKCGELLKRITSEIKCNYKVWYIYGLFNESTKRISEAKNCYMTECRNLKQSQWKDNENLFSDLCIGMIKLMEMNIKDIENSHLNELKMFIDPVLIEGKEKYGNFDGYKNLLTKFEELKSYIK